MLTETQISALRFQFEADQPLFAALNAAGLHHIIPRGEGHALWVEWKRKHEEQLRDKWRNDAELREGDTP